VHADDWAMSATRRDPAQEREALMMGCLMASARAANGTLTVPQTLPAEAHFETPPAEETQDGWHIVSCPSPHVDRPRTTLGLGDTFMAGCLLVLGQEKLPVLLRLDSPALTVRRATQSPHHRKSGTDP
jgi:ADP-dependent phosphofructokinase/glucokinase